MKERSKMENLLSNPIVDNPSMLSAILEHMAEGVCLIRSRDSLIVYTSPVFDRMFGYERGELLGKHISVINAPGKQNPQQIADHITHMLEESGSWGNEIENIRKDGTVFWCRAIVSSYQHPEFGKVWVSLNEDITERKHIEGQLAEERNMLKTLINSLPEHLYIKDTQGHLKLINTATLGHFGASSLDEVIGKTDFDFSPPELAARYAADEAKLFQSGESLLNHEQPIFDHATGTMRWVLTDKIILRDNAGNIVGLVGINHDITQRKQDEEQVKRSQAQLNQAQQIAHLGSWEWDIPNDTITWSEELYRIFGLTPQTFDASYKTYLQAITPEDRDRVNQIVQTAYQTQEPFDFYHNILRPDGVVRVVHAQGQVTATQDGKTIHMYGTAHDVTELKNMEDALRQQEELYHVLVQNLPKSGVVLFDHDLRFLVADGPALSEYGFLKEKVVGKTLWEVISPERQASMELYYRKALAGENFSFELDTEQDHHYFIQALPVKNPSGDIFAGMLLIQDISERKLAEAAYRDLVEKSLQGVTVYQDNRIVFANPAIAQLLGYSVEELLAMEEPGIILHPEDRAIVAASINKRLTGQPSPTRYEHRVLRKDGEVRWIEHWAALISYHGKPAIQTSLMDITERKHAESRFRALLESAPDAMVIVNREGSITLVNTQTEKLFGYLKAELLGKAVEILMPESFRESHMQHRGDYANSPHMRNMGDGLELFGLRKDGTQFPIEVSLSPIETEEEVLVASAIRDVTERKRAQKEIEEARRRAEEASILKSQFLANMSHELRTPLNAVIGFSDVMLKGILGKLTDTQQEYLQDILSNGEHLLTLINDILDLSKIEAGQFDLNFVPLNPGDLLHQILDRLQGLADVKGLDFTTYVDPHIPTTLISDERRLKQILINLIGNAIKFTEEGQVEARVEKLDDSWWTISVIDTGIGIPAEAMPYLFDEFRQVDNSLKRKYEGTGLGLAIVRKLTSLMGGKVSVESEPGKGSKFTVQLPLVTEAVENEEQKP